MKTFNEIEISDIIGLSETKKRDEFHKLVQSIDLLKDEDYDCSSLYV